MTKEEIEKTILEYFKVDGKKYGLPYKVFQGHYDRRARELAEILTAKK